MAIVDQHERFALREYNETQDEVTYKTSYYVKCDNRSDGLLGASASTLLPTRRVTIVTARNGVKLRCKNVVGKPLNGDDLAFEFEALFSSKTPELNINEQEQNPLLRRADVNWSFATSTEGIFVDDDGKGITSSAGEPYDPPVEVECNDPTLVYQQNVATFDPSLAIDYCGQFGSYNSDNFSVPVGINGLSKKVVAGSAHAHSITADNAYENGIYFMKVRIEIWFRPLVTVGGQRVSAWDLNVLDQGTLEYFTSADGNGIGGRRLMRDDQGAPTNKPQLLDGFGRKLQPQVFDKKTGAVIRDGKPAVYRNNRIRRKLAYGALSLKFP